MSRLLGLHSSPLMVQEDSSLTRSDAYFLDLLKRSGYIVTGSALQRNFPKGLFKVMPELLYRLRQEGAFLRHLPPTSVHHMRLCGRIWSCLSHERKHCTGRPQQIANFFSRVRMTKILDALPMRRSGCMQPRPSLRSFQISLRLLMPRAMSQALWHAS